MLHKVRFVESRYIELHLAASCVSHHSNRTLYSVSRRNKVCEIHHLYILHPIRNLVVLIHYNKLSLLFMGSRPAPCLVSMKLSARMAALTIPRPGLAGDGPAAGCRVRHRVSVSGKTRPTVLFRVPDSCIALEMTQVPLTTSFQSFPTCFSSTYRYRVQGTRDMPSNEGTLAWGLLASCAEMEVTNKVTGTSAPEA